MSDSHNLLPMVHTLEISATVPLLWHTYNFLRHAIDCDNFAQSLGKWFLNNCFARTMFSAWRASPKPQVCKQALNPNVALKPWTPTQGKISNPNLKFKANPQFYNIGPLHRPWFGSWAGFRLWRRTVNLDTGFGSKLQFVWVPRAMFSQDLHCCCHSTLLVARLGPNWGTGLRSS